MKITYHVVAPPLPDASQACSSSQADKIRGTHLSLTLTRPHG